MSMRHFVGAIEGNVSPPQSSCAGWAPVVSFEFQAVLADAVQEKHTAHWMYFTVSWLFHAVFVLFSHLAPPVCAGPSSAWRSLGSCRIRPSCSSPAAPSSASSDAPDNSHHSNSQLNTAGGLRPYTLIRVITLYYSYNTWEE